MRFRSVLPLILVPALALALSGCGAPVSGMDDDRVAVVASTDVYGDLVELVGGDAVRVTSLIAAPNQDPHSFEASARDRLAITGADLVIVNGGGYDPFMDDLLDASASDELVVLDAFELAGLAPGANEHVWYQFGAMEQLAGTIAHELSALDPADSAEFRANLETVRVRFDALDAQADALRAMIGGRDAAITEPVPLYLLERLGLANVTPAAFSEAIEEGSDVAPRTLEEMLDIVGSGDLVLLAYNDQTTSAQTERVRATAEAAGVPVVVFTETLPEGLDYPDWMAANLDAVAAAVG
jgi:zinc/manganese transport system substrate-binding protein